MFRLEIATDSATFDDNPQAEVARILRRLADGGSDSWGETPSRAADGTVCDINGSTVGYWKYTPEDTDAQGGE